MPSEREQRGLMIAATSKITRKGDAWLVPAQTGKGKYTVSPNAEQPHCTCPDHETLGCECKHIFAVRFVIQRELFDDGTEVETRQVTVTEVRKTYRQDWPAYNRAQTSEKATLQVLLHDLCKSIPESTEARMGRPRLPIRDGIFCAVFKVYSMLSSRRFISDLCDAQAKGFIGKVPHFNSVLNVFDSEETAEILTELVALSAAPLAAIESNFAVDSSGFSGCRYDQWHHLKWKNVKPKSYREWVKAHCMIGTTTNVITAAKVLDRHSADINELVPLMDETAKRFKIGEVSADKAYLAEWTLQAISDRGASALIPFKSNSVGGRSGVWNQAFHYFNLHREEFLARYHRRSNIESTFSMIKRKYGDSVKAKNNQTMKCEVLAKFVAHNLSCLIHAMEEFGIDPTFGCTNTLSPAQLVNQN
jgi:transposase